MSPVVTASLAIFNLLDSEFPDVHRVYYPDFDLDSTESSVIAVVPMAAGISRLARNMIEYNVRVDVALMKKLLPGDSIDSLMDTMHDIFSKLNGFSTSEMMVATVEHNPILSDSHFKEHNHFMSLLQVSCKVGVQ